MSDPSSARATEPRLPGLATRMFRGESDLSAMCRVANASRAADGIAPRELHDMARDYASYTDCEPRRDVLLVELDGELVAYARVWRWMQADGSMLHSQLGFVEPRWRRHGIGSHLQRWIERRHHEVAASIAAAVVHQHQVFIEQQEEARRALILASGYRPERHFFEMRHSQPDQAPDFALPPGLELRPVRPEHYRAIWDSHLAALQDHWGMAQTSDADYQAWLTRKWFQPARWQIAWDIATNEVAGQVKTWIDEDQNALLGIRRGYTEHISVARPWRRKGVARALVARSLRTLAEAGMTESMLGVDSENLSGATRVYEDCGFRVVKTNAVYRKPLVLHSQAQ